MYNIEEIDTEYYDDIFKEFLARKKKIKLKFKNLFDSISNQTFGKNKEFIKIYKKNKVGVIDIEELLKDNIKKLIQPIYDSIIDYKDEFGKPEYFLVKKKNKIGVVNSKGNEIMPFKYKDYNNFNSFQVIVKKNNKLGIYNFKKNIDIKPKYSYIKTTFIGEYLFYIVRRKKNYFYINEKGQEYFKK